jgi:hypothetical protein
VNVNKDWGQRVRSSFNEWAAQVYDVGILRTISTDYLRTLRSEMLQAIGRIDDEMRRREHSHSEASPSNRESSECAGAIE